MAFKHICYDARNESFFIDTDRDLEKNGYEEKGEEFCYDSIFNCYGVRKRFQKEVSKSRIDTVIMYVLLS